MDNDKFIWGVPGDLPGEYDLELTYNESKKCYHLNIETIYYFTDNRQEYEHFRYLLTKFENWMCENGHYTTGDITLNDILYHNVREFPRIEKAFYWFRFMVRSFGEYHGYY